jgi:SNF2 family DNA or RNA helicase
MPRDCLLRARDPRNLSELSETLRSMLVSYEQQSERQRSLIEEVVFLIPRVRASPPRLHASHPDPSAVLRQKRDALQLTCLANPLSGPLWAPFVRTQLYFPDKRLIQYDCGKLQRLATLLRDLKAGGHRALIFTQMTKMLDVLEIFLNLHGHTYLRLDGSTKVEHRQKLTERFNRDPRVFLFILSTRSGGLGLNLTGADTVIFYDSDWNPAMDAQACTLLFADL